MPRLEKLEALFDFVWNNMESLESDNPKYLYVSTEDFNKLEDLCLAIDGA